MELIKAKVFMVDNENKEAHVEFDTESIPFDAFHMCLKDADVALNKGDVVEVSFPQLNEGQNMVQFVRLISRFEVPKWEYEKDETVQAKLDFSGELQQEPYKIVSHEYLEDEEYYWCVIESTVTGDQYDAIAPSKKGEPFTLATYKIHS